MDDKNLIFLISQPRSGSSLTQQLILNSEVIDSTPEPWQMLSLIHTYKHSPITSGYNPNYTTINYNKYLETIDDGVIDFKRKIKEIALAFYKKKQIQTIGF